MNLQTTRLALPCMTSDGVCLHVHRWVPDRSVKALVVVAHGILEHGGRYVGMAESLNRAGIAVWAPDARGHGRSGGRRVWVDRFDRYSDDLLMVLAEGRAKHPQVPVYLFGHSMGALVALKAGLVASDQLGGLVLSAPPLSMSDGLFPLLRKVAAFGSRWFPRLRVARIGSSMLSRDSDVVAQFRADPLVFHGRIPTRTGAEILRVSEEMRQRAAEVTLPMLLLQGTADAVVSWRATEAFYRASGSGDKTLRLYRGAYHDLPREPEKEEISGEIASWIIGRC